MNILESHIAWVVHKIALFILIDHYFQGARLSDSGAIKCVATNLLGKATSMAQLIIEGKTKQAFLKPLNYI